MDERIVKYFSGELPEREKDSLLREAGADEALRGEMLSYQNTQALLMLASGNKERHRVYPLPPAKPPFIRAMLKYAAVAGLAVALTWMAASYAQQPGAQVAEQQELHVPAGQRARITLPDGSVAWLNAGSTLLYPSVFGAERKVRLSGEAYFDVAKHPDKPFIVTSEHLEVEALGTQFNMLCYPKAQYETTSLVHGSIIAYKPGKKREGIVVSPNRQLVFQKGRFIRQKEIDKDELLWKDGIYSFNKERLDVIVKKLELYYDTQIIVKDPRILKYEYSGKFRQRDGVMEILRLIQKIHNFKIDKNEELNIITITR